MQVLVPSAAHTARYDLVGATPLASGTLRCRDAWGLVGETPGSMVYWLGGCGGACLAPGCSRPSGAAPFDWVWVPGGVLLSGISCMDAGLGAWTRGDGDDVVSWRAGVLMPVSAWWSGVVDVGDALQ